MTASIFIKSCRKDRFYLDFLLRSLAKFSTGFREIVVVLPEGDRSHFEHSQFYTATVKWVDETDGQNYLKQQIFKIHADEYTAGDVIVILDSDTFCKHPISPGMFMPGGKPIYLIRHWQEAGSSIAWKPIAEKFLTYEMMFEGMSAMPILLDRRVLPLFREYAKTTHGCSIDEYILRQPGNDFSEFEALSSFALRFTPYLFDWRIADPSKDGFPRAFIQRWSWDERGVGIYSDGYEKILASEPAFATKEP